MSILIKGMEMPTSCTECPCCRYDNWNGETAHQCNVSFITFGAEDENWIYNTRPNWCPLIEIPTPHGRLIDADKFEFEMNDKLLIALTEKYGEKEAQSGLHFSFRDCICNIQYQPTVIEAEGSKDE